MTDCMDFVCPSETHFKKLSIDGTICSSDNCLTECCNEYEICGQWTFNDNECSSGELPEPSRSIPNEGERHNLSIENICCDDVKCTDYTCPNNYKKISPEPDLVYSSGIYSPLETCCERKKCQDWLNDGNTCSDSPQYLNPENRDGYSEYECCYQTCDAWGLSQGSNPCDGGIIIEGKIGWGSNECCLRSRNTCFHKTWDCPEKKSLNIDNLDQLCDCGGGNTSCSECLENDVNIEKCCRENNLCSSLTCPANYHLNPEKRNERCLKRMCTPFNDLETCCLENETCSSMSCGTGYHLRDSNKDKFCLGAKCTVKDDRPLCCSENSTCHYMNCPNGYYKNEKSKDKKCYEGYCDPENRFNLLRCCRECKEVENSKTYTCTTKDNSIATSCNEGFILKYGLCKRETESIVVLITIGSEYDDFILIDNYSTKLKNDLCTIIKEQKGIQTSKCLEMVQINEIKQGSVVASFTIETEKYSDDTFSKEDIQELFKKDTLLSTLNLQISEDPRIQATGDDTHVKCSEGTYEYQCPFYMSVKKNAPNIHGASTIQCCDLNWDILKYIIPLLLLLLLIIYGVFKLRKK